MDPRRDYPNFTDAALEFFIRRFPSHPDHAAAVGEVQRRGKSRKPRVESATRKVARVDNAVFIWAVSGIVILSLVILFFLLSIVTASRKEPASPSEPSTSVQKLSPLATHLSNDRSASEVPRHLNHGEG